MFNNVFFSANCNVDGIDYPGNDISTFAVSGVHECGQRCQSEPRCALYAYSSTYMAGLKVCWLKTGGGTASMHADFFTGFKNSGTYRFSLLIKILFLPIVQEISLSIRISVLGLKSS